MSKTPLNYWAEFAVDIPLGVVLIFAGLRHSELDSITIFLTILLGLFLFSFIEYSFHRWLMHGSVQIFVQGHRAHHENPLGYDSLPFFLPALILWAEPFHHPPPPFSACFRPKLGGQSSHPSLSFRNKLRRYDAAMGYINRHTLRVRLRKKLRWKIKK
jgi:hypothetical protein